MKPVMPPPRLPGSKIVLAPPVLTIPLPPLPKLPKLPKPVAKKVAPPPEPLPQKPQKDTPFTLPFGRAFTGELVRIFRDPYGRATFVWLMIDGLKWDGEESHNIALLIHYRAKKRIARMSPGQLLAGRYGESILLGVEG